MSDATICHSLGGPLFAEAPNDGTGSLVQIYPAGGSCGMWHLDRSETHIGRGYGCEVYLEDDAASRRHAAIQQDDEGYLLVDLNSTNGTFVNNEPVQQHRLMAGDRIRIGTHILKYLSADHIELQYHETVFKMTTRDGLTEAFNRQYMTEFLERELSRSAERERPVSVGLLDIDFFKQVNDQHGHLAGDEVLREVSRRASHVLHAGDLYARFGGEEFCVVFCESDSEEATRLAQSILNAIEETPFPTISGDLSITASFGVATWHGSKDQEVSVESLLKASDEKLYEAKETGRNRVCATVLASR